MSADNDKKKRWAEETGEEPGSQTHAWLSGAPSQQGQPAPDAAPAPKPPAQKLRWDEQGGPPQLTHGQRLLMMIWIALGLLGAVLPLMLASWVVVVVLLFGALEHMDEVAWAKRGGIFDSGGLIRIAAAAALIMIPAAMLKPLAARLSSRMALVSFAYLIAMKIFYMADGKLPTLLFHALVLGCGAGVAGALPWSIGASLFGLCRDAWHWLERHAFWAGAATVCGGAAVGATLIGWLAFGAELTSKLDAQPSTAAAMQSPPIEDSEGDAISAFGIPSLDAETSPLFHACVDELHAPRPYEGSWRDQALRILQRRAPGVEEDIAQDALIKVCLRHQKSQIVGIGPYYISAINNLATKTWHKNKHLQSCPSFESIDYSYEPDFTSFIHASRALCKLDEQDRQIIVWLAQGFKYPEIAAQLGITHDAARQRGSRASRRAQELMPD